jgi:hypothetical protein
VAISAGVDLAEFSEAGDGDAMRKELGLSRPVIGSVAMFRGSKGHAPLLDAFATVHARHPSARLLLVGDGIRRAWVEGLAKERGLAAAVLFTGFRSDVPDLLRAMDCFVLASTRTEGVPQSLLQAFAAGIPAVGERHRRNPRGHRRRRDRPSRQARRPVGSRRGHRGGHRRSRRGGGAGSRRPEARRGRFSHVAAVSRLLALYDEVLAGRSRRGA